jgi:TetR/AcrR family transcriptional regulator, cholesterol catabolism regulator
VARASKSPPPDETPTLDRVLSTAAELFRTHGYAATTTREIAARLGIQKASLYYHINSKEDLLYELIMVTLRANLEAIEAAAAGPGTAVERLRRALTAHLVGMHSDPDKNGTALTEMRSLEGERRATVVKLRDEYEAVFRHVIEDGQKEGLVRDDMESRYLVLALLSMANWTLVWYHQGGGLKPEQLAEILLGVFLDGALAGDDTQPRTARRTAAKGRGQEAKARSQRK